MIKIIPFDDKNTWDEIVYSFKNHDIYYYHGYVDAFRLHGDGTPILILYESACMRGMYVTMKRDLSLLPCASGFIQPGEWFDLTSPYGYGGWLFEGDVDAEQLTAFNKEYRTYMLIHHYVCNFARYSPVLNNADVMRPLGCVTDLGKTVTMDLDSQELIWNNITSKNRNMIRKAMKNGVTIEHSRPTPQLMAAFKQIYDETMRNDQADEYYFFGDSFYQSLVDNLSDHTEVFYAKKDDQIIAASIMLYANGKMHYHLSGTVAEYRNLAPTNLLLYQAALWGHDKGFEQFHLGGGLGSGKDGLYKFKASFNRQRDNQFSIGKEIYNNEMYQLLVEWRENVDPQFDSTSSFFPIYRQSGDTQSDHSPIMATVENTHNIGTIESPHMKKIAIYGAGGLGREVAGGINRINKAGGEQWEIIGFYDDNKDVGSEVSHYGTVLGGINELNEVKEPLALAIAVGSPKIRKLIFDKITNPNISYPNLIAPSFKVLDPETFTIGRGNIIQDNCSATCNVTIGDFNVLNGSDIMGHDVVISNYNVLMPGVHLSGAVNVGDCNLLGVDSVVLQKVRVGSNITLGAGSVLMTKPKDGYTYIGVPAKKFEFE